MKPATITDWQPGALAYLCQDNWAGRIKTPVAVVGPSAVRRAGRVHVMVRLQADTILPGRRRGKAGDELAVPCYALLERA